MVEKLLWMNFLLNAVIFLVVFNITRVFAYYRTKRWVSGNPAFTLFLPLGLALLITVIDSFRMFFAYQLAIFVFGAIGVYWAASQLSRRKKW